MIIYILRRLLLLVVTLFFSFINQFQPDVLHTA